MTRYRRQPEARRWRRRGKERQTLPGRVRKNTAQLVPKIGRARPLAEREPWNAGCRGRLFGDDYHDGRRMSERFRANSRGAGESLFVKAIVGFRHATAFALGRLMPLRQ
ncbi:hypothetical protein [Citrobacter rodentium]|uniref:hypothetical protein n=1 Tax=Citrobacter rodentium TaxID=67825 RepID=UPI001E3B80DE|nr:hypothetical protein [Citrobacter rodentium]